MASFMLGSALLLVSSCSALPLGINLEKEKEIVLREGIDFTSKLPLLEKTSILPLTDKEFVSSTRLPLIEEKNILDKERMEIYETTSRLPILEEKPLYEKERQERLPYPWGFPSASAALARESIHEVKEDKERNIFETTSRVPLVEEKGLFDKERKEIYETTSRLPIVEEKPLFEKEKILVHHDSAAFADPTRIPEVEKFEKERQIFETTSRLPIVEDTTQWINNERAARPIHGSDIAHIAALQLQEMKKAGKLGRESVLEENVMEKERQIFETTSRLPIVEERLTTQWVAKEEKPLFETKERKDIFEATTRIPLVGENKEKTFVSHRYEGAPLIDAKVGLLGLPLLEKKEVYETTRLPIVEREDRLIAATIRADLQGREEKTFVEKEFVSPTFTPVTEQFVEKKFEEKPRLDKVGFESTTAIYSPVREELLEKERKGVHEWTTRVAPVRESIPLVEKVALLSLVEKPLLEKIPLVEKTTIIPLMENERVNKFDEPIRGEKFEKERKELFETTTLVSH